MIGYVSFGTQISGDIPAVLKALEEIGNQLRSKIEQSLESLSDSCTLLKLLLKLCGVQDNCSRCFLRSVKSFFFLFF